MGCVLHLLHILGTVSAWRVMESASLTLVCVTPSHGALAVFVWGQSITQMLYKPMKHGYSLQPQNADTNEYAGQGFLRKNTRKAEGS